jgi:hypothetical protein
LYTKGNLRCLDVIKMTTETTVKISKWVSEEIESFVAKNRRNRTEFPSKKNLVDKAVINLLEEKGVKLASA